MNKRISNTLILKLLVTSIIVIGLFAIFNPFLRVHRLHLDERYYIGRAMQNNEFLFGNRSASGVWFSNGNHPFTAEFIIGLSLLIQGQTFGAPHVPWFTHLSIDQIIAAREGSFLIGLLALAGVVFVALDFNPLIAIVAALFLLSSPGFVNFSMMSLLDIYVASFTTLTLVCLYFYFVKANRKGIWLAAIFLGLALGSKTSWDPIIAGFMTLVAVILVEFHYGTKRTLGMLAKLLILTLLSFAITSPIILIRLSDHIHRVLAFQGSMSLANLLTRQPLVSTQNYTIFSSQTPINLLIFGVVLVSVVGASSALALFGRLKEDMLLKFLAIVGVFISLDLLLTGLTFEFGFNYGREPLYQALLIVIFLGLLHKLNRRIGLIATSAVTIVTAYSMENYLRIFQQFYAMSGSALIPSSLVRSMLYAPSLGWFLLVSVTVAIPVLSLIKLTPSWRIIPALFTRWRKH